MLLGERKNPDGSRTETGIGVETGIATIVN